jgi:hypothetical protein
LTQNVISGRCMSNGCSRYHVPSSSVPSHYTRDGCQV